MNKKSEERPVGRNRVEDAAASPAKANREEVAVVMERFGSIREMDRSFDIEYWQRQGDSAIFRAAWELVEFYYRDRGVDPNELRLQRSLETFQRS
jgi:hypothetical protein